MDYRYNHPLFTEDDKDIALNHLIEYLENNNVPEYKAISNDPFEYSMPIVSRDVTKQIIEMQYGVNIISMANFLIVQDLFFSNYMPHLSKYLNYAGIKFDFSYMRMSKLVSTYLVHLFVHNKRISPLKYWDPNILWKDFSYKKDNQDLNMTNPTINFYNATLNLYDISNHEFIIAMDKKIHGIKDRVLEDGETYNINIKLLPSLTPLNIIRTTKLIHKYF